MAYFTNQNRTTNTWAISKLEMFVTKLISFTKNGIVSDLPKYHKCNLNRPIDSRQKCVIISKQSKGDAIEKIY